MIVHSDDAMQRFGRQLAVSLRAGDWLAINGPLGAGKTVLCKGILHGLGFAGEVTSPSYAIVHHYDPPDIRIRVVHADLYRIDDAAEIEQLGLDDECGDCITLVEWASRADADFGNPSHWIDITPMAEGYRKVEIKYRDKVR